MSNHVYKMGDDLYKQADGAPAGSEYAGIIARAVTRSFDRRYLKLTAERGLNVVMYGPYIDNIDQIIEKQSKRMMRSLLVRNSEMWRMSVVTTLSGKMTSPPNTQGVSCLY